MAVITVLGNEYNLDTKRKPQILKRGLMDHYDKSKLGGEFVVLEEYIYWSAVLQKPIVIPRWFRTDLASIPQLFRSIISVNERHRLASLPHDLIYGLHENGKKTFTRSQADAVLNEFCKYCGVPGWKRSLIVGAVRIGGWVSWGKKRDGIFIDEVHRKLYIDAFPELDLEMLDGAYIK